MMRFASDMFQPGEQATPSRHFWSIFTILDLPAWMYWSGFNHLGDRADMPTNLWTFAS